MKLNFSPIFFFSMSPNQLDFYWLPPNVYTFNPKLPFSIRFNIKEQQWKDPSAANVRLILHLIILLSLTQSFPQSSQWHASVNLSLSWTWQTKHFPMILYRDDSWCHPVYFPFKIGHSVLTEKRSEPALCSKYKKTIVHSTGCENPRAKHATAEDR